MKVMPIKPSETHEWCLHKHYAKRIPSISCAFGLFVDSILAGIVSYGVPASPPLLRGICGDKYKDIILELNRLCINKDAPKNAASFLVGNSIKFLPKPSVIVSYADTAMNHIGYVYQAANFIYTGLSAKRTDWKIKGEEHLHGATIADRSRGQENRAEWMREQYGDDFYLGDRPRKHRYIFIHGTRRQKKDITAALMYKPEKYPKGRSEKYDANYNPSTQAHLML